MLAELHAIDRPEEVFGFLGFDEPGATALRETRCTHEGVVPVRSG